MEPATTLERQYRTAAIAYVKAHVLYIRATRLYRQGRLSQHALLLASHRHGAAVRALTLADRAWCEEPIADAAPGTQASCASLTLTFL